MAAGELSGTELKQARAELDKINAQHGFRRNDGGRPQDSPVPSTPAEVQDEGSSLSPGPPPKDPGPPRFTGVDLEARVALLSGPAGIPISELAYSGIVGILLGELRAHMSHTLGLVAETHKAKLDPDQLDLFKDQPANGTP